MYKVLIVDDDKLARKGIISIVPWEACGFEVVGDVANGALALEFVEQHEVDLAVVDMAMPVLSGIDFIRECKKKKPQIQYVILSSYESFEYIQQALRMGVLDYISKLQLDEEDCVALFTRVAAQMKERSQRLLIPEKEKTEEMKQCYELVDSLYCFYNREKMQELAKTARKSDFSEKERYRLMLHILHVIERNFSISLPEEQFDSSQEDCSWILRQREALLAKAKESGDIGNMQVSVLLACIYIEEHLEDHELKAQDVGDKLNLSRSYFSTSFKKYTGYSLNSYMQKERVELAKEIMKNEPELPFADVAFRVGYMGEKYFARMFYEREGMTYSEYKNMVRKR